MTHNPSQARVHFFHFYLQMALLWQVYREW